MSLPYRCGERKRCLVMCSRWRRWRVEKARVGKRRFTRQATTFSFLLAPLSLLSNPKDSSATPNDTTKLTHWLPSSNTLKTAVLPIISHPTSLLAYTFFRSFITQTLTSTPGAGSLQVEPTRYLQHLHDGSLRFRKRCLWTCIIRKERALWTETSSHGRKRHQYLQRQHFVPLIHRH